MRSLRIGDKQRRKILNFNALVTDNCLARELQFIQVERQEHMGELIDKIKGKAKQAEAAITGNRARKAEGVADELKGKAKGAFEEAKTDVKKAIRSQQNSPSARAR